MIYFFIEQSRRLAYKAEEKGLDYQDIYINAMQEMQEKYSLPSLNEWGDGYCKGDASLQELIELKDNINSINNNQEIYLEIEDDEIIDENLFSYLDRQLIELIETKIDSYLVKFGENEYTKDQFQDYKEELETIIKDFLHKEYYMTGGVIGHDYSLYLLADDMVVFEMVHASSNWKFPNDNEQRFKIVHLNNYDSAFKDYTDLISENNFRVVVDNLGVTDNQISEYLYHNDIELEDIDIKETYSKMSYDEKVEMFDEIASEGIKEYNSFMRNEAIDSIMDYIDWDEIENYFLSKFEN